MPVQRLNFRLSAGLTCVLIGSLAGCSYKKCAYQGDYRPTPLGTYSDPTWRQQEANAEASDFVVHEHEWVGNTTDLNDSGKEHVKQIAARAGDVPFPILVERSSMTVRDKTKYKYPVHGSEALDLQRRDLLVTSLSSMGVVNAADRVVVSTALAPGFREFEAERAYDRGMSTGGMFGGGFGGGGMGGVGGGFY